MFPIILVRFLLLPAQVSGDYSSNGSGKRSSNGSDKAESFLIKFLRKYEVFCSCLDVYDIQ